jgi:ABC-2 type transport system ATP-binding protein
MLGMIKAQDVQKWFGPNLVVDHVSFEVQSGEVLGFLGPNGAGKSTTMRMLTGFLPLSGGKIDIDGHDIETDPIAAKALVGYLPENAPAYNDMTVEGFLAFCAAIRGFSGNEQTQAVEKAIETCHLQKVRRQNIETLSKGYFHRCCFAQAILHDPPVLVLDEPTDGLDPNQKHEMRMLIRDMGKSKAIIVSTHILEEVEAICSRVIIIDQGKLVFNGSPADLRARSTDAGAVQVRIHHVPFADIRSTLGAIAGAGAVNQLGEDGQAITVLVQRKDSAVALAPAIKTVLDKHQWHFDELHTESGRLDDVFRTITSLDSAKENKA